MESDRLQKAGVLNLSKYLSPLYLQVTSVTTMGSALLEFPGSLFPAGALSSPPRAPWISEAEAGRLSGLLFPTLLLLLLHSPSSYCSLLHLLLLRFQPVHLHTQPRNWRTLPCSGKPLILHPKVTKSCLFFLLKNHPLPVHL